MKKITRAILPNIDLILAAIGISWIGVVLARYAIGGPLLTDILLYLNVGLNHVEQVFILNRYFHVFLEQLFVGAAPTPLIGFQNYWAFLIAATAFLVYYNARSFTGKSHLIHALLAVGIFFSVQEFAIESGIAGVDLTAMFMVMLVVTVFMASIRRQHRSKWLLILLGILFYLAFKTKETTLVSGLLFIGLGFVDAKFSFKVFWKNIVWLLVGVLAGVFVFAMLSWVMLGDPFFGLRPSEILTYLKTYVGSSTGQSIKEARLGNWYVTVLLPAMYIPFIFYVVSGIKPHADLDPSRRLLWWLPLGLIIFVSLSASIAWGARNLLPAIPIICVLAPQFLNLEIPESRRDRIKAGVFFLIALALLVLVRLIMRSVLPRVGWDTALFLVNVFEPVILSIILAIIFFWKRLSLFLSIIIVVLIVALITSPLITNFKTMVREHPNEAISQDLFYPFSAFSSKIHYTPKMKMLVSLNAWKPVGMANFTTNVDEVMSIFNIYFNAGSNRSNYTISASPTIIKADLLKSDDTYALMSLEDWQFISSDPLTKISLEEKYQVNIDPKSLVVLLEAK